MRRVAVTHAGTYYHRESIEGPRYRGLFDAVIPSRRIDCARLEDFDAVIVADRTPPDALRASARQLNGYAENGGFLVVMGEVRADTWLSGVSWTPSVTNYWWWLERGADPGLRVATPDHDLFRTMTLDDATWHYHGFLAPPPGARSLIDLERDGETLGSLLYEDDTPGGGRVIVSTLDPFYHHGSHFMPATTRFLDRFLPWVKDGG